MEYSNKKVFVPDDKANKKQGIDLGNYTHIRAYHACRPINMESYLEEGIIPFHVGEMRQIAAETFGISLNIVTENEATLQDSDSKHVYFSLFKEELLNGSGHYLCWGSEYLAAIAGQLDKGIYGEYHDMLSNSGIPTIFVCDIPIDLLPQYQVDLISEHYNPRNSNFAVWISETLKPEHIVTHEHPTNIYNPLQGCQYINKQTTCEWCVHVQK
ncbi:hypothetical protein [Lysinibacillus sp. RS5]|uniref:hypothetical protein n=1 Tax=unclassified Lysinibacillus TaxID=2636778 RepID=UPI0035BE9A82